MIQELKKISKSKTSLIQLLLELLLHLQSLKSFSFFILNNWWWKLTQMLILNLKFPLESKSHLSPQIPLIYFVRQFFISRQRKLSQLCRIPVILSTNLFCSKHSCQISTKRKYLSLGWGCKDAIILCSYKNQHFCLTPYDPVFSGLTIINCMTGFVS